MKTIEEGCLAHIHETTGEFLHKDQSFKVGVEFAQKFILVEEEKPPYGEDILVQSHRGAIYFGMLISGISGRPDFFSPDCSEDSVNLLRIKSWRPIFYK